MQEVKARPLTEFSKEFVLDPSDHYVFVATPQKTITLEGFEFVFNDGKALRELSRFIDTMNNSCWEVLTTEFRVGNQAKIPQQSFGVPIAFLEKFKSLVVESGRTVAVTFYNSWLQPIKLKVTPLGFTFEEWREAQRGDHMEPHLCRFCENSPCMCEQD